MISKPSILFSHSSNVKNLVELYGNVYDTDGDLIFHATALWCACDRKHYTLARILIENGKASVYHGPNNPLLLNAIYKERLDTIEFLIENNYADINRTREKTQPHHNGLIVSAARGQTKIVEYLLKKGATINYKTLNNETALSCAAKYGRLDIVKLLCSAGASTMIKNINEETPLILAFKNNRMDVIHYLIDFANNDLCIDELELIACSFAISERTNNNNDQMNFEKMIHFMQKIFQIRKQRNFPKEIAQPILAYSFHQECQTIEEFEKIQHDYHRLYIEALIIRERILLGKKNPTLCEPLLKYGQKLIEQNNFEECIHLWEHTFYLYQTMEHDTSLHRFVWLFCKMIITKTFISPKLFLQICYLTFQPAEQQKKHHSIKNSLCLVTIAAKVKKIKLLVY